MLPFFWVFGHSLESSAEWRAGGVTLWPSHLTLHNYSQIITQDAFLKNVLASLVVSSITTVITLVLASLAGYALARLPIRGRGWILGFVILAGFFPIMAMMGPLFLMFRHLHLLNTWLGVSIADSSTRCRCARGSWRACSVSCRQKSRRRRWSTDVAVWQRCGV